MYVRDAKNRDEAWLLDQIEAMGLDDVAFRSRDYVIALDEETNEKAGFGRIRLHGSDDKYCELTGFGVRETWRNQGVGGHVVERLVGKAKDAGFTEVYVFALEPGYLTQFGFEPVERSDLPSALAERFDTKRETVDTEMVSMRLAVDEFEMPVELRERFKIASPAVEQEVPEELPEDFGIDPESATYKYDTGR